MRTAIVLIVLVMLAASCGGGGGGGKIQPIPPGDNQNPQTPTYNRSGAAYMPTASSNSLTYSVVQNTSWPGVRYSTPPDPVWEDAEDTTYRRANITIDGEPAVIMQAVPDRPQRHDCPAFDGARFIGTYEEEWQAFDSLAEDALVVLPAHVPDIGGTWTVGAVFHYSVSELIHVIVSLQGEVIGLEDVTVPSGTYEDALKVRYSGQVQIDSTINVPGPETQTFLALPGTATIWYVDGLGPVRGIASSSLTGGVEIVLNEVSD